MWSCLRKAHKFFSSKILFLYFLSYFSLSSLPTCSLPSSLSLFLITVLWKIQNLLFTMTDFLLKVLPAFSSVQFSHSVVSDSLQPHEPQHTQPPSPSPTPGVHPNSCPLIRGCHPTISSSVIPFSSHLESFPASRGF